MEILKCDGCGAILAVGLTNCLYCGNPLIHITRNEPENDTDPVCYEYCTYGNRAYARIRTSSGDELWRSRNGINFGLEFECPAVDCENMSDFVNLTLQNI